MAAEIEIQVVDERIVTIPPSTDAIQVEQLGKALVDAGQSGYALVEMNHLRQERGTQRDPYTVVLGTRLKLRKPS